jgi:hypothetical protein
MEPQQLDNAAVHAKKEKSNWWWPKTDSLEHARDAAKYGSIAFGYIAIGSSMYAAAFFTGHLGTAEDRNYSLIVIAIVVYTTWCTYKRPTVLLNCIAFVLMVYVLGMGVITLLAALAKIPVVAPRAIFSLSMSVLGTLAAFGGIRGSLAVRRFNKAASHS